MFSALLTGQGKEFKGTNTRENHRQGRQQQGSCRLGSGMEAKKGEKATGNGGLFHIPRGRSGYKKRPSCEEWPFSELARPERFELPTARFVAEYSIQLSYGRLRSSALSCWTGRMSTAVATSARLFLSILALTKPSELRNIARL